MKENIMSTTTFSGPVVSGAGFTSDDTINASNLTSGSSFNLTDFTVRPTATYTGTVAALVGSVNQRTAGVSGGNMFGCYAQTSFSNNPTSTITGLNTAVYGVVDCGSSTNIGAAYGSVFDFAQFAGTRGSAPKAFIGFGEESVTNPCLNLFDVGRLGKNVGTGLAKTAAALPSGDGGSLRILVNGLVRYLPLYTTQS